MSFFLLVEINIKWMKYVFFVKILSQGRRKERGRIVILRSASASSSHLKKNKNEKSLVSTLQCTEVQNAHLFSGGSLSSSCSWLKGVTENKEYNCLFHNRGKLQPFEKKRINIWHALNRVEDYAIEWTKNKKIM